jgi:hypothetical protein
MSGRISGAKPASRSLPASGLTAGQDRVTRILGGLAIGGLTAALLIMIAASLLRASWMFPHLVMPAGGAPWGLKIRHVPPALVTSGLWVSALLGGGGVAAGLVCVQRGAQPNLRVLLVVAALVVTVLAVLPPAGSTDALDYSAYGRIMALGHSPYVMTPYHLRITHPAFGPSIPHKWQHYVSVYGPAATIEQFLAAKLGGALPARIVFWLKLWNALAFGLVAVVLDRLLRARPVMRLRAHLLWTLNPLLLWDLIAAGHLDVLAAAAGLLGLIVLGEQSGAFRPRALHALGAGALLGLAADIKSTYVLFALALAWVLRRSPGALAAAAGGALAVLVPTYAWFGLPAVKALLARRNTTSADNFYQLFIHVQSHHGSHLGIIAAVLVLGVAVLLMLRLPPGLSSWPAIRPALALSVAWLFFWPYQLPWYDTMAVCLLVLYPASRLDWLVLARLTFASLSNMPGNPWPPANAVLAKIDHLAVFVVSPLVLLGAAVGVVLLCLTQAWNVRAPRDMLASVHDPAAVHAQ